MTDSGFPRGRGANPKGGANLIFGQFFPKTAWKWRNFGRGGGPACVPRVPLRSVTDLLYLIPWLEPSSSLAVLGGVWEQTVFKWPYEFIWLRPMHGSNKGAWSLSHGKTITWQRQRQLPRKLLSLLISVFCLNASVSWDKNLPHCSQGIQPDATCKAFNTDLPPLG